MTWCSEKAGMAGAGARRWVGTQGDDVTGRPGDPEFEETTWVRVWGLRSQRTGMRVGPVLRAECGDEVARGVVKRLGRRVKRPPINTPRV